MFSKSVALALILVAATSGAFAAQQPTVINFDDVIGSGSGVVAQEIGDGYKGYNWNNFYAVNTSNIGSLGIENGYTNGTISGSHVAYNGGGTAASFSSIASPFNLYSGFFTSAWNDGNTVTVFGYANGTVKYVEEFVTNTHMPRQYNFSNWTGLTSVTFSTTSGQVAIDDLTVSAVPEPETYAMMLGGLCIIGFMARRRKQQNA